MNIFPGAIIKYTHDDGKVAYGVVLSDQCVVWDRIHKLPYVPDELKRMIHYGVYEIVCP
jgi:hypothetical protein